MNLIKLNATDSTNTFLSELAKNNSIGSPTVVIAENQTASRGQRNGTWYFEPSKSMAMSVYVEPRQLLVQDQFYLSMSVALSIQKVLEEFRVPKVQVKWPNDILSRSKKLVGILIENTIKQNIISSSIIGIGLNVNNPPVATLPRLGSMFTQTKSKFDIEVVAKRIIEVLIQDLEKLEPRQFAEIKKEYERNLFRNGQVSSFSTPQQELFSGIIRGVNALGQLQIETSLTSNLQLYWAKEVSLKY